LGGDPISELELFSAARSVQDLDAILRREVEVEVSTILEVVQEFDAFDVIELMRLREFPIVPAAGLAPGYDGSGAVLDLIALVMLTRPTRNPSGVPREHGQPHEVIDDLHTRAQRLVRLSSFWKQWTTHLRGDTALPRIAAQYQSYFVGVRRYQYDSVEDAHERALFDRPEIDSLLNEHLGFTYAQFVKVRDGVQERYSADLTECRDVTGEIVLRTRREGREPTPDEVAIFRSKMVDFMFLPGARAAFTADAIAAETGLDITTVVRVLQAFTIHFGELGESNEVVMSYLRGRNPLARACLLNDGQVYLQAIGPIGSDSFRSVAESSLKPEPRAWRRYDRTRTMVSESIAVAAVERLLDTPALATNLQYWAPKAATQPPALGPDCEEPRQVGELVESDAIFVVGDVAVCVEVKGRTIADAARRGDVARLETEIANTIGEATRQAQRLESLIRTNGGVWRADSTWLDLDEVREIRSVVVGLDYFGPLSVCLGDLQDTNLLGDGCPPWIVSIADLEVIAKVLERPAEFLLYLRRRTDSGVAKHFRAMDELDMFMLFMAGGLYVAPDPDEVRRVHPRTPPASRKRRREHREDARPTFVGTHTDPLDLWMYWNEGTSREEAPKPTFNAPDELMELLDWLAKDRKPGWLRFGADLLGLSGEAQTKLLRQVESMVDRTSDDHEYHTLIQAYAGMWGYPSFFAATYPTSMSVDVAANRLDTYMTAKKHQLRSDRSLGILLDEHGTRSAVVYMNDTPTDDETLDALGTTIGIDTQWSEPDKRPTNTARRERDRRARNRRR
jgi:hypothetical protein